MEIRQPIKLAERRIFSDSFKPLYNEGMSLVERTAEYLDGPGRGGSAQAFARRRDALLRPNRCGSRRA